MQGAQRWSSTGVVGDRRRRGRRLGPVPSGQIRLDRHCAGRALGAHRRIVLARGRRHPCAQRRPEHGGAPGLHHRPAARDRAGIGPGYRAAYDRRNHCRLGAGALGMAPEHLPHLPDHRHRGLPPDDAGGDQGTLPDHGCRRRDRRPVGRPRRLCRYHRHGSRLCRRRAQTGRHRDRAQPGARTKAAAGPFLGRS